jgi:hypothetical protein
MPSPRFGILRLSFRLRMVIIESEPRLPAFYSHFGRPGDFRLILFHCPRKVLPIYELGIIFPTSITVCNFVRLCDQH